MRFRSLSEGELISVLDESTLEDIANRDGGSMTPALVDEVFATDDPLQREEASDAELNIVSTTTGSIVEARKFLLRIFNPGSQPTNEVRHEYHKFHLEDTIPFEGYLG